jgi:hypothetical protein
MTPLPPVANCIKYQQSWHIDFNLSAEAVLHFSISGGPPNASQAAALAASYQAAAVSDFKALMNPSSAVGLGTVTDISSDTGVQATAGEVTAGTRSGTPNAAAVSLVANHQISRRYRGGKPRTYCPWGNAEDLESMGTWTPTFLTNSATAWSSFITTCLSASSGGVATVDFVCVSYFLNKEPRSTPLMETINLTTSRTRVGSQRKRNKTA